MNLQQETTLRQATLENIRVKLKSDFFGIDKVIDSVIDNISTWYCLPEVMRKPLIINLLGTTGCGKTDLVRKLVRYLELSDAYVEVQMTDKGIAEKNRGEELSFATLLFKSMVYDKPAVLMIDEIQRYRTLNGSGETTSSQGAGDIWQLLSDGTFNMDAFLKEYIIKQRDYIEYRIATQYKWIADEDDVYKAAAKLKEDVYQFITGHSNIEFLNQTFNLFNSPTEIESFSHLKELFDGALLKLKEKPMTKDYTKLLIFICGNLKDSYREATYLNDIITPDELYELTTNISLSTIKKELLVLFSPEQVARFGNNYIVYPTIDTNGFREIIRHSLENAVAHFLQFDTNINIDLSVDDFFLENWVSPVEGVRPLVSAIEFNFTSNLSKFIINNKNNKKTINLSVVTENDKWFITDGSLKIEIFTKNSHSIKKDINQLALEAVHEVGHLFVHCKLLNVTPVYTMINEFEDDKNSLILSIDNALYQDSVSKSCSIFYGGRAAEEVIFGLDLVSAGAISDIEQATSLLMRSKMLYGFTKYESIPITTTNLDGNNNEKFKQRQFIDVSKEAQEIYANTLSIVKEYKDDIIKIANVLLKEKIISGKRSAELLQDIFPNIKAGGMNDKLSPDYLSFIK